MQPLGARAFSGALSVPMSCHNAHIHIDNLWLGYQYHLKPADNEGPNAIQARLAVAGSFRLSHDHHVRFLNALLAHKVQAGLAAIDKLKENGKTPDNTTLAEADRNLQHYSLLAQKDYRSVLVNVDFSTWPRCMIADEQRIYYCDMTPGDKCAFWTEYWQDKKIRGHFFVNWYWRLSSKVALR